MKELAEAGRVARPNPTGAGATPRCARGRRGLAALEGHGDDATRRLAGPLAAALPRRKRAVGQAERRVLKGDPVASGAKLVPHVGEAPPGRRAEEKGRRSRAGSRFRAGIEGRIHALKRDAGLRRCRDRGERGFGRWVGWGILAHNLAKVAGSARG